MQDVKVTGREERRSGWRDQKKETCVSVWRAAQKRKAKIACSLACTLSLSLSPSLRFPHSLFSTHFPPSFSLSLTLSCSVLKPSIQTRRKQTKRLARTSVSPSPKQDAEDTNPKTLASVRVRTQSITHIRMLGYRSKNTHTCSRAAQLRGAVFRSKTGRQNTKAACEKVRLWRTRHGCAKAAKSQSTGRRPRWVIRGEQEALPRIHLLSWHSPTEPNGFLFRPLSPHYFSFYISLCS